MKGFSGNIEELTLANNNFRQVLYTARYCQLVLMSL
ncbi:cupin domain-containing protein, partial [TM7 phylum sp. oral taxon 352]